jgi:hypothetical protein
MSIWMHLHLSPDCRSEPGYAHPVRASSRESSVVAGPHDQTETISLQDPEPTELKRGAKAAWLADDLV